MKSDPLSFLDQPVSSSVEQSKDPLSFLDSEPKSTIGRIARKAGRIATQYGISAAENLLLPYEAAVAPLASKGAQTVKLREHMFEEIERLGAKKRKGGDLTGPFDEQDQELLDNLLDQIRNPEKMEQYVKTTDIGVRGLAEKATGKDLQPEGFLEKAAGWLGFLKDPRKGAKLVKDMASKGIDAKTIIKNVAPGEKTLRSLGAAAGLEAAEEGEFGPIGTITAALVGDVAAGGVSGAAKKLAGGKKTLAEAAAKLTRSDKLKIQQELIKDFRDSGIQTDIGTITDSNLIKIMQTRLAQSGLTGNALEDLKKTMTAQIKEEYKNIADTLGEIRFQTLHEAGEVSKEYLTKIRDAEKTRISNLYERARAAVKPGASVEANNVLNAVKRVQKSLSPGTLKSAEQEAVIKALSKVEKDIKSGKASVLDLMNSKVALGDIVNFEVQGGQKKLLIGIQHEIDNAIKEYGKQNPIFAKYESRANSDFKRHAQQFRNPNIDKILTSNDPSVVMNKMNTVQGIRDMQRALSLEPEGKKLFGDLKRLKLDQMIGNKMTDNVSEQLKTGKFSNLLQNPKDKQLALELLGKEGFSRLERLQKVTGKIAQTANKFLNASKSGTTILDATVVAKALKDISMFLSGNPWPLINTVGGISSARYVTKLISDPEFLKMVEDAVLASSRNDTKKMLSIGKRMEQPIKAAVSESRSSDSDELSLQ